MRYGTYEENELVDFYNLNENNDMNGIGTISWMNIKSALMFALLSAFAGLLFYIIGVGSVWKLDWHVLVDIFSMALANGLLSAAKSLLTTSEGNFLGVNVRTAE